MDSKLLFFVAFYGFGLVGMLAGIAIGRRSRAGSSKTMEIGSV